MNRLLVFFALAATLLSGGAVRAQERDFGLGIIIGDPIGLSAKVWLDRERAFDFAAAWAVHGDHAHLYAHADYLLHADLNTLGRGRHPLLFYYGLGVRVQEREDRVGARLPLGLDFLPRKAPLEIFGEIVPVLDLLPGTAFDLEAGLGIRYYF